MNVTCAKWHIQQTEFGPLIFPETKATEAGVVTKVNCPYTALKSGAVSIFGEPLETEESGGFALCKLTDDGLSGEWLNWTVKNCRKGVSFYSQWSKSMASDC